MDTSSTTPGEMSPSMRYYLKNREAILAKEREKKRWVSYYERNKEAVRERNRHAYLRRKEAAALAAAPPAPPAPPA